MLYRLLEIPALYKLTQVLNPFTTGIYRRLLRELAPQDAGALLLDLGCGLGDYKAATPCRYLGIDANPRYMARAARLHGPTFIASDATALPFANATFDAILIMATLHHLSDDQVLATLAETHRTLKPNGFTLIIDPVLPAIPWPWKWALFKLDRGRFQRTARQMNDLLAQAGTLHNTSITHGLLHDVMGCKVVGLRPTPRQG